MTGEKWNKKKHFRKRFTKFQVSATFRHHKKHKQIDEKKDECRLHLKWPQWTPRRTLPIPLLFLYFSLLLINLHPEITSPDDNIIATC